MYIVSAVREYKKHCPQIIITEREGKCTFIYFEKAFDSVSWDFIFIVKLTWRSISIKGQDLRAIDIDRKIQISYRQLADDNIF